MRERCHSRTRLGSETQLHVHVVHSTTQPPGVPDYWPNLDLWESHDIVHPVMNLCPVLLSKKKKKAAHANLLQSLSFVLNNCNRSRHDDGQNSHTRHRIEGISMTFKVLLLTNKTGQLSKLNIQGLIWTLQVIYSHRYEKRWNCRCIFVNMKHSCSCIYVQ